ncbi:MAG: hypothetical protein KDG51_00150 [Calditrichaeota bacterium]|nr:hypothetical protein [Calditrichota bacterium]
MGTIKNILLSALIAAVILAALVIFSACAERKQISEPVPGPLYDSLVIGTPHLRPGKVFIWADTVVIMDSRTVVIK